jgi:hypothetical protein
MTDKTWIGGFHHNDARNPHNWSPNGAPQPGDNLLLPSGSTISIQDNDLQGDPLVISSASQLTGPTTLNLSHHADVTLTGSGPITATIKGTDTLNLNDDNTTIATVNLASHAHLFGNFRMNGGSLTIAGAEHSRFVNNGADFIVGGRAVIDADVVGSGAFTVTSVGTPLHHFLGFLEFGGLVTSGQSVSLDGSSSVRIDQPREFHGTVQGFGLIDLVGLAHADSWCYKNDMLSIFNAQGRVVDRLHEINASTVLPGLSVSMSSAGDVLVRSGSDFYGVIALPTS